MLNSYNVGLYIRLSREDDDKVLMSESIKNQKSLLLQYVKENNLRVYDIYIDDGYSGTNFDRPDFKRLLKDIELGKIRVKKSGSAGTLNGMRNIVKMISSEDFPRVRVGTDKPKEQIDLVDYVLSAFTDEENEKIEVAISHAAEATMKIVEESVEKAMNEFNGI